jgi:hypothetical protein
MITEDLENELRRAFARAGADIEVPDAARMRLCERNYHPRRTHRGAAGAIGAVALATAAGIAVPLGITSGPAVVSSGAKITLDAYTFTMPAGYHATRRPCLLGIGIHIPRIVSGGAGVPGIGLPKVPPQMRSAASADGGCVGLMLSPAYRPQPGSSDPYAIGGSPVLVGEHKALLYDVPAYSRRPDGKLVPLRPGMFDLFVPVPTHGGKVRDLVIGSDNLTKRELIAIAISGLSS